MTVKNAFLFLFLTCLGTSANALERRYLAQMEEARWTITDNSKILCRLEHSIPKFGHAVFSREAGRRLQLEIYTTHKIDKGVGVELIAETVHWKKPRRGTRLAQLQTNGRQSLFKIPRGVAERTFHELGEGNQPGFVFQVDHPVIASLSTVRFGSVEQDFNECVKQLHGVHFDDVRLSDIHFDTDDEFASLHEEETALMRMLNYLQVDDSISEIVVNGHADKIGAACYNDGLSERRAWYVYDLLVAGGIDSSMLRVDYHGEQRPLSQGSSNKSLAANRRVTVELRR